MFDPLEGSPSKQPGRLHSFTLDGGIRIEPDAAELHNGMAWSADGSTFFLHAGGDQSEGDDHDERNDKHHRRAGIRAGERVSAAVAPACGGAELLAALTHDRRRRF